MVGGMPLLLVLLYARLQAPPLTTQVVAPLPYYGSRHSVGTSPLLSLVIWTPIPDGLFNCGSNRVWLRKGNRRRREEVEYEGMGRYRSRLVFSFVKSFFPKNILELT